MGILNKPKSGAVFREENAIHDLSIAYVSSRKDVDKMSVKEFLDAYIKAADEIERLRNESSK